MKTKFSLLLVATCFANLIPFSASAVTFEELVDALSIRRACPVEADIE